MTNEELITALRVEPFEVESAGLAKIMNQAADLIEAQAKRIAELEAQLPKEGEWQWLSSTYDRVPCEMSYWCSVCHHEEITHYERPWKHYCPNCGARMEVQDESA